MEKVFVVTENWVVDYEDGFKVTIFKNKEKAKKYFDQAKKDAYTDLSNIEDVLIEESESSYSIYEAEAYSENHINVELSEEKILD